MGNSYKRNPWYKKNVPLMMEPLREIFIKANLVSSPSKENFRTSLRLRLLNAEKYSFMAKSPLSANENKLSIEIEKEEQNEDFLKGKFESIVDSIEAYARELKKNHNLDKAQYFINITRLRLLLFSESSIFFKKLVDYNRESKALLKHLPESSFMPHLQDKGSIKRHRNEILRLEKERKLLLKKMFIAMDAYIIEQGIEGDETGFKKSLMKRILNDDCKLVDPYLGTDSSSHTVQFVRFYICRIASSSLLKKWLRKFNIQTTKDYREFYNGYQGFLFRVLLEPVVHEVLRDTWFTEQFELDHFWDFQNANNVTSMKEVVYGSLNPFQLVEVLSGLEEAYKAKIALEDRKKVATELTWGTTVLNSEVNPNFFWEDLETDHDVLEGRAMTHCGSSSARGRVSSLVSLRQFHVGEKRPKGYTWEDFEDEYFGFGEKKDYTLDEISQDMIEFGDHFTVHITATVLKVGEKAEMNDVLEFGLLSESKGFGNSKPSKTYHPYFIELVASDAILMVVGGGYASHLNFHLSDLDTEIYNDLLKQKPELNSFKSFVDRHGKEKLFKGILGWELSKYPIHKGKVVIFNDYFEDLVKFLDEEFEENLGDFETPYFEEYDYSRETIHGKISSVLSHIKVFLEEGDDSERYADFTLEDIERNDVDVDGILTTLIEQATLLPEDLRKYIAKTDKESWDFELDVFEDVRDQLINAYADLFSQEIHSTQYKALVKTLVNDLDDDTYMSVVMEDHKIIITADPEDILDSMDERIHEETADENLNFSIDDYILKSRPNVSAKTEVWLHDILNQYDYAGNDVSNSDLFEVFSDKMYEIKGWEFDADLSYIDDK